MKRISVVHLLVVSNREKEVYLCWVSNDSNQLSVCVCVCVFSSLLLVPAKFHPGVLTFFCPLCCVHIYDYARPNTDKDQ